MQHKDTQHGKIDRLELSAVVESLRTAYELGLYGREFTEKEMEGLASQLIKLIKL